MKKTQPTPGAMNVDTPQMQEMRAQVVEQELSARSWKAYWEKMHYSMEAEKLEPEYKLYKERMQKRLEEEKKQYEEFMAKMQEQMQAINEGNPLGELTVDATEKKPAVIEI